MIAPTSIFSISSDEAFRSRALEIFRHQAKENPVYREFIQRLQVRPEKVDQISAIPFLPISFFKTHRVLSGEQQETQLFTSSGTTGTSTSRHYVADAELYRQSFLKGFEYFYGALRNYRILALLPGYLERSGSSLVAMAEGFMQESGHPENGFFLYEQEQLLQQLISLEERQLPSLLIGVSHALLDFAEKYSLRLKHCMIMETGGMKGRRKELIREELHARLKSAFGLSKIHSEYGMTELLSQAYSRGNGRFQCPPWMRIHTRELNDPFALLPAGQTGGINIIDLANIHSCSFIATDDLGKYHPDGSFEVLGRFDNSDIRGCNLLVN